MKAIILAAGKGTRLQPLTFDTPKPLLFVKGMPILEHILNELPEEITEVFLIVDHLKEQLQNYVSQNLFRFSINCIQQIPDQKGTLAALYSVKNLIQDDERFLVLNGDDLVQKKDLEQMIAQDRSFGVFHTNLLPRYYKVVEKDNKLDSFEQQSDQEKEKGVPVATGTYVLDRGIFELPTRLLTGNEIGIPQTILDSKDIYPVTVVHFDFWQPINSLEDLSRENAQ